MKKLVIIALVIVSLLFIAQSCERTDEDLPSAGLIGTGSTYDLQAKLYIYPAKDIEYDDELVLKVLLNNIAEDQISGTINIVEYWKDFDLYDSPFENLKPGSKKEYYLSSFIYNKKHDNTQFFVNIDYDKEISLTSGKFCLIRNARLSSKLKCSLVNNPNSNSIVIKNINEQITDSNGDDLIDKIDISLTLSENCEIIGREGSTSGSVFEDQGLIDYDLYLDQNGDRLNCKVEVLEQEVENEKVKNMKFVCRIEDFIPKSTLQDKIEESIRGTFKYRCRLTLNSDLINFEKKEEGI